MNVNRTMQTVASSKIMLYGSVGSIEKGEYCCYTGMKENLMKNAKMCGQVNPWERSAELVNNSYSALLEHSPIDEIQSSPWVVTVRAKTGLCAAYDIKTMQFLCYLNTMPGEVVRSVFYNSVRDEMIKVSVFKKDNFVELKCFAIKCSDLLRKMPYIHQRLYQEETLTFPGFVEFDQLNIKAVTFSPLFSKYKIWDLRTHQKLLMIDYPGAYDIKITPDIIIVLCKPIDSVIPLVMYSLSNGEFIERIDFKIQPGVDVSFVERCGNILMVKQKNRCLSTFDLVHKVYGCLPQTEQCPPNSFTFLYKARRFLVMRSNRYDMFDFNGKYVLSIGPSPQRGTLNCISRSQRLLCMVKQESFDQSVVIYDVYSGEPVGEINVDAKIAFGHKIVTINYVEETHCFTIGNEAGYVVFYA